MGSSCVLHLIVIMSMKNPKDRRELTAALRRLLIRESEIPSLLILMRRPPLKYRRAVRKIFAISNCALAVKVTRRLLSLCPDNSFLHWGHLQEQFLAGLLQPEQSRSFISPPQTLQGVQPHTWQCLTVPIPNILFAPFQRPSYKYVTIEPLCRI